MSVIDENPNAFLLRMSSISKSFGSFHALSNVNFDLRAGEIHGLIGENGAGKSTLMRILGGVYPASSFTGEIMIGSSPCQFHSAHDSENAGIAMIHQELELAPNLTVDENINLGREVNTFGVIRSQKNLARTAAVLQRVGLAMIDPHTKISELSLGQRQLIEIGKALVQKQKIIILDEPTTSLSLVEAENLLSIMRTLANEGTALIFITHRLDELMAVSDRITVLRDGKLVGTRSTDAVSTEGLVEMMVGRPLRQLFPQRKSTPGSQALEVLSWTVPDAKRPGLTRVKSASFSTRTGEIVVFAGLVGAGRTELARSLICGYGAKASAGSLKLGGLETSFATPKDALRKGLAYVTEDRKDDGLVLRQSIGINVTLCAPHKVSRFGIIRQRKQTEIASQYIKSLNVKCRSLDDPVGDLSGGNQQKILLAKYLLLRPKVIILDEPTRGVDVGARLDIYTTIAQLAESGSSVIVISSDMQEVIGLADRVIVMCEGAITGELVGDEVTEGKIMELAIPKSSTNSLPEDKNGTH